jgi:FG-GAP-like repeat
MLKSAYLIRNKIVSITGLSGKGINCPVLLGVLLFSLFDIFNAAIAQEVSFTTNTYRTGHAPYCVVAADVNEDGKLDLISANLYGNTLTVLTNSGTGGFGSNCTINVGTEPDFIVAADINGDGKLDLITANSGSHTLTVLTNDGSGAFGSNATLNVGAVFEYFVAVDINGDGILDLITANFQADSLTVLTNDGSGVFGFNTNIPAESPLCVVAADVNGDGKPDLITAAVDLHQLTVFTNNRFGVFVSNATLNVGSLPNWLVAADVNGDGKPDLVTANYGDNTLTVLTNNGSGVFGSNATLRVGVISQGGPVYVVAADINGDGKSDLISVNYTSGTMTLLTNNFGLATTMQVGPHPTWVTAADVNGDGKLDLITAIAGNDSLSVFINDSTFPTPTITPSLNISRSGNEMLVSWPSASPGWSLQQNPDLTTANWLPSGFAGYGIVDNGTNKSLSMPPPPGNLFFRLLHP